MPDASVSPRPSPRPATARPAAPPARPGATRDPQRDGRFGLSRLLVILGYITVWVAAGVFSQWQYIGLLTSDPMITGLLLIGLVFNVWLAFKDKAWLYLVAALTGMIVPLFVLFVFGLVDTLNRPQMGGEFIGSLFLVLALLLAIPAGVYGFVSRLRARPHAPLARAWRSGQGVFAIAVIAAVLAMAMTGGFATAAMRDGGGGGYDFDPADLGAASHTIRLNEYQFHDMPTIQVGQIAELVIVNEDSAFHTFTYERNGVEYNHDVVGGGTATFLVLFQEAGEIKVRCLPHSLSYDDDPEEEPMVGSLVVVAAT